MIPFIYLILGGCDILPFSRKVQKCIEAYRILQSRDRTLSAFICQRQLISASPKIFSILVLIRRLVKTGSVMHFRAYQLLNVVVVAVFLSSSQFQLFMFRTLSWNFVTVI
ncbi:hypothetical protein ACU8KH_04568 [Lachancea thermotolerans]